MLKYRPHHFLCTLGFQGKGYSDEFVRGFAQIADRLRNHSDGDQIEIQVVSITDSICQPCPNRQGDLCATEEKIQRLDRAHQQILELMPDQVLTWGEAKQRIADKMTLDQFEEACAPCAWKALGVCRSALMELKKKHGTPTGNTVTLLITVLGALGLSTALLTPTSASANHPKATTINLNSPHPIDVVQEQIIYSRKSKEAKTISSAMKALQAGKPAQTRKLAEPLQNHDLFSDYGYALTASSYRDEAANQVQTKSYSSALANAKKAHALFMQIVASHPYSPWMKRIPIELGKTEIVMADSYFGKKHWDSAQTHYERAFERLVNEDSLGLIPLKAVDQYAQSCARKNNKGGSLLCEVWIQKLVSAYPKHSLEFKAIAKHLPGSTQKLRPPRSPEKTTARYRAADPDNEAFDAALELYFKEDFDDAADAFKSFLKDYPKSTHRHRAAYLLGLSLTQEKDHDDAQKIFQTLVAESPLSYYGLLASFASGKSTDAYIDAALPTVIAQDPFLKPHELIQLRRAEHFLAEGAMNLASLDLNHFRARDSLSSPFLMYLATLNHEAGNHRTGFNLLSELIQRGYPGINSTFALRLIFPVAHIDLVEKHSNEYKLDPILILSQIKQESAFDHDALSWVGASGLMQLMPATAVDTDSTVHRSQLVDPDTNVRLGTKYLAWLMKRYNGNAVFALAGYNAGAGNVDRWIRASKDKPHGMIEFIERIPFKETRDYVSSIIRNYYWYTRRIKGEAPQTLNLFWSGYGPYENTPKNEKAEAIKTSASSN